MRGLKFVQWQINIAHHETIKNSPFRVTFGAEPQIGLTQNVPVKKDVAVEDVHAKGITCPAIHVVIQELVATTMSE